MAYMLPQPPETSWTSNSVGESFSESISAMADSAGLMDGRSGSSSTAAEKRGVEVERKRRGVVEAVGACVRRVMVVGARTRVRRGRRTERIAARRQVLQIMVIVIVIVIW
jgi:hypothetical protein